MSPRPRVRVEVKTLALMVSEPPPWIYEVSGDAHIDDRLPGTLGRMQTIEPTRFTLRGWELVLPRLRAGWRVTMHTRLLTEYGLPFALALAPVGVALVSWLRSQAVP